MFVCESAGLSLKVALANGKVIEKGGNKDKSVSTTSVYRSDAKSVHTKYYNTDYCSESSDIERYHWAKCDSKGDDCVWFVQTSTNY